MKRVMERNLMALNLEQRIPLIQISKRHQLSAMTKLTYFFLLRENNLHHIHSLSDCYPLAKECLFERRSIPSLRVPIHIQCLHHNHLLHFQKASSLLKSKYNTYTFNNELGQKNKKNILSILEIGKALSS